MRIKLKGMALNASRAALIELKIEANSAPVVSLLIMLSCLWLLCCVCAVRRRWSTNGNTLLPMLLHKHDYEATRSFEDNEIEVCRLQQNFPYQQNQSGTNADVAVASVEFDARSNLKSLCQQPAVFIAAHPRKAVCAATDMSSQCQRSAHPCSKVSAWISDVRPPRAAPPLSFSQSSPSSFVSTKSAQQLQVTIANGEALQTSWPGKSGLYRACSRLDQS